MCARVDTGKENQKKGNGKPNITILMKSNDTGHFSYLSFGIYLSRNILLI